MVRPVDGVPEPRSERPDAHPDVALDADPTNPSAEQQALVAAHISPEWAIPDGPPTGHESEAKPRDARLWRKRYQSELASAERRSAIEQFAEKVPGLRLVSDAKANKIVGVATWNPESESWDIRSVEASSEGPFRKAGLKLLTGQAGLLLGKDFAPPTTMDDAAELATDVIDPWSIALKLCNKALQAVAHAHGLGFIAPEIGRAGEDLLASIITPPNRVAKAETVLQVIDVTADVEAGRFTGSVYDLTADSVSDEILKRKQGISRAELEEIQGMLRRKQARVQTASLHHPEATEELE